MKTIHRKMRELNEQKLENRLKETESSKNDSSRIFRVIKEIQRQKPKIPLVINIETRGLPSTTRKNRLKLLQRTLKNSLVKTPKY